MQFANSATLNDLKSDLYFIGKFNAGTFSQNDLNRIINKYYKQAQTAIRAINEDFYAVPTRANLLAGTDMQYSWPTDYEKIKFIELALRPKVLTAPTRDEYARATIATSDQITSPGYIFQGPTVIAYGDYFEIPNTIASTVTGGVRMVYIPLLAELKLDTDTPNIFEDFQDVITWGALIDIAPRLNNDELLVRASQMFQKRLQDLKDNAANRIADLAGEYVEGQSSGGGWDYPFTGSQR